MQGVAAAVTGLVRRHEGQDLIEYGVLVALIAIVAIAAVTSLGAVVNNVLWLTIVNAL